MLHAEPSGDAWLAWQGLEEGIENREAQARGNLGMDFLCEARRHSFQQGHREPSGRALEASAGRPGLAQAGEVPQS